jgi:hypothetical protein
VDECSTNVRMMPLWARAPKGEWALGKVPKNWKNNVTLICFMNLEGIGASMSIESSADGEAFLLYVLIEVRLAHAPRRHTCYRSVCDIGSLPSYGG